MFNFKSGAPSFKIRCYGIHDGKLHDICSTSNLVHPPFKVNICSYRIFYCDNCYLLDFLKGGCTRFEVEHISCNLLLYIGKT